MTVELNAAIAGRMFAVVGPTASGKSAVALDLATRRTAAGRPTEIVAVDAFTVYQGMDIGTAKPTTAQRFDIPHHMIDVYTPDTEVTVAAFQRDARHVIDARRRAGVDLVLVGGSGLYFRAVVDDLRFPPTDPDLRVRLERSYPTVELAYARLQTTDPNAADTIAANNYRRVIRALEVKELTGESFSVFHQAWQTFTSRYDGLQVGYLAVQSTVLAASISQRATQMVAQGLLDEAAQLRQRWQMSRTALQAIGYAEAFAVLDGAAPKDTLVETIAQRTRRYARRQRTWFRADPRCVPRTADELHTLWDVSNEVSHE
jgi:tRNA dimethylallyltransferase